jgi:hypothetical protein
LEFFFNGEEGGGRIFCTFPASLLPLDYAGRTFAKEQPSRLSPHFSWLDTELWTMTANRKCFNNNLLNSSNKFHPPSRLLWSSGMRSILGNMRDFQDNDRCRDSDEDAGTLFRVCSTPGAILPD